VDTTVKKTKYCFMEVILSAGWGRDKNYKYLSISDTNTCYKRHKINDIKVPDAMIFHRALKVWLWSHHVHEQLQDTN
jgi:hypothetical protein